LGGKALFQVTAKEEMEAVGIPIAANSTEVSTAKLREFEERRGPHLKTMVISLNIKLYLV
jgi:hypothetical protein